MRAKFVLFLFFVLGTLFSFAQTATLQGIVLDENNVPVPSVSVTTDFSGTQTNENGFYSIKIPANQKVQVSISHIGFKPVSFQVLLSENEEFEFNPVLKIDVEQISAVIISSNQRENITGITSISPETIRKIPGANAGVENLLKTLPGVISNNELSTQYAVRGGNYDENLVYVNEIEVYRPFLIRSGQQEGLSFVNTDLVREVEFSAGGFQAKYGDKLSSVLDITYRRTVDFGATLDASLLGGSISVEGISKNKKLSGIVGLRYRDNALFVEAKQTETNYEPVFADAQAYLIYNFSEKLEFSFLGNISVNKYNYQPLTRQTNFGTLQEPIALLIFYEGQEVDQYETYFGAIKTTYKPNDHWRLRFIASAYNTQEQEHFDILAQYRLGQPNTNIGSEDLGEVEFSEGVGSQLTHARNDLDALIFNFAHKGTYKADEDQIDYGLKFTHEDIRDRIREYEIIDSAGFSIRPPLPDFSNSQPYEAFEAPLAPFNSIRAFNETQINRISGFLQWSRRSSFNENELWYNIGVRSQHWTVSGENFESESGFIVSPRAQFAIKPNWKKDMLFRISGGFYHQPPFYRELRDENGAVNPKVEAQQSIHFVIGNEYSFKLWKRPFKLVSEAYYKDLSNVNPYTLDNVRIRYAAQNNAEAYAYGIDLRLNGEFVSGTESWVSLGYLKTEENINNRGFIARPTDQRLKLGILFQDYMPMIPNMKVYLNQVYSTGLPGGSPSYADPYLYQTRLRAYWRSDVGFSYVIVDSNDEKDDDSWTNIFEEFSVGFEIFNLFDRQNSITSTYVRDVYTKTQYAVPNYLSPRIFNLRVGMKF
ncbi:MAG TPA: carboxypeptidase-like regulatory domain-containing protein [Salinimicrobium sp.]|nr:carboxypeptidase-like regulatory domain-containing protein [Salinimicrobium sp.]